MEQWEQASNAARQEGLKKAVCWECGQDLECIEYVVCCTGTMFHICPACEEKVNARDAAAEGVTSE